MAAGMQPADSKQPAVLPTSETLQLLGIVDLMVAACTAKNLLKPATIKV